MIDINDLDIGKKVQEYRTKNKMTVRSLSAATGITGSMISQIEHNQVNPSINTLKALARTLQIPLYYFFQDDNHEDNLIVRRGFRKTIGLPEQTDVTYQLLTPSVKNSIEFCMMTVPGLKDSGDFAQHTGEEVSYVVNGSIEITVGTKKFQLNEGDSIVIPPMTPHLWTNTQNKECNVIFAVTPPSF